MLYRCNLLVIVGIGLGVRFFNDKGIICICNIELDSSC